MDKSNKAEFDFELLSEDYLNNALQFISFKIIILGNLGVGKSELFIKRNNESIESIVSIGCEFNIFYMRYKDTNIKLQIWHTCGHEMYRSISGFYGNASLAIIIYAIDE